MKEARHILIAVRGGLSAKQRCAGLLCADERAHLTALMLKDMLRSLAICAADIWVVTPTAELSILAREHGCRVVDQVAPIGLNEAFVQGTAAIRSTAPEAALALLPADLPLLAASEMARAFALLEQAAVVVAPSRGGGTGGLLMRGGMRVAPLFGADSAARHADFARSFALPVALFEAAGFYRDIDTPTDLFELADGVSGSRAAHFLRESLVRDALRYA